MVSLESVEDIHKKMVKELGKDGIEILKVYYCPHHWDDNCSCRKPEAGMFYQASKEFLFRLDKTCYVGDDDRDMVAATNAGCSGILWRNTSGHPKLEVLIEDKMKELGYLK